MTAEDEDDALRWAGDRDPSLFESATPAPVAPARAKRTAAATDGEAAPRESALPAITDSALLITFGILGGVYLLYSIGWGISLGRFRYTAATELDQVAFEAQQFLAVAAPALWFAASLWFTRSSRSVVRLVWLVVGALVLVPWSFVFGI